MVSPGPHPLRSADELLVTY